MGFTFDDKAKKKVASPLQKRLDLIQADPWNAEQIFPYLGGKEINENPGHLHHQYEYLL